MRDDSSVSTSAVSSATSDSDHSLPLPRSSRSRAMKNTKRLSLALPSHTSSVASVSVQSDSDSNCVPSDQDSFSNSAIDRLRRPSIASLPNTGNVSRLHRKGEDDSPSVPYLDGPIQILPGVWLGSEDNARDWKHLVGKGIRSILNVAREVACPFESSGSSQPLRAYTSAPNLKGKQPHADEVYYPPHVPSGRPGMHYLKLNWSHGQSDLVLDGFVSAMNFVDAALDRGDGVLIQFVVLGVLHSLLLNFLSVANVAFLALQL